MLCDVEFVLSGVAGLVVGLVLGWFGHVLDQRRTQGERAITDATELWDRCGEIATARVKYILAYHRKASNVQQAKEEHLDLKRRYRWADPEVVLLGTPEWNEYHVAERSALKDKETPIKDRIRLVETTSYALFDAIGKRRTDARK
jgi:hypothetical protein